MLDDDLTLLSYKALEALGYGSKSTISRRIKAGKFPKPDIDLSAGDGSPQPRWRACTVRAYQRSITSVCAQNANSDAANDISELGEGRTE